MNGYNASPLKMMLTPVILVVILLLIPIGMVLSGFLARNNYKISGDVTIGLVGLIILLWLIGGLGLPASINIMNLTFDTLDVRWHLYIDPLSWRTSLFVLIVAEVILLIQRPRSYKVNSGDVKKNGKWLILSIFLLMLLTTLLGLWSDSFFGLMMSWSGIGVSWFAYQWNANQTSSQFRQVLVSGSPLMLAIGLLAITGAVGSGQSNITDNSSGISASTLIWGTLAGLTMLGGVPLVLQNSARDWRASQLESGVLAVLLPSVAGAFFLARMATFEFSSTLFLLIMTGLGLIGFLFAVYLALIGYKDKNRVVPVLLLAWVCIILLTTLWSDSKAVVAHIGIFSLSIGTYFFITGSVVVNKWTSILPAGAIAGMPLTLGFTGLTGLYYGWLNLNMYPLFLVTALLISLFIAAVILALRSEGLRKLKETSQGQQRYLNQVALVLISLCLLDLPHLEMEGAHIIAWIAILLSIAVGTLAAWYIESRMVAVDELRGIFRVNWPALSSRKKLKGIYSSYIKVIEEAIAILEGEGGMLWVLVLVIILWLARQG